MDNKNVLLLGVGILATDFIKVIKEKGFFLTAVDLNVYYELSNVPDLMNKIDNFLNLEDYHPETFYNLCLKANKLAPLKAIIPTMDEQVVPVALIQEQLGLKGPGLHAALLSTNKVLQRHLFSSFKILTPQYSQISSDYCNHLFKEIEYPVILKPINQSGSKGVKIVESFEEAKTHAENITKFSELMLIEEYIEGPEFSVESLVQDGVIIFSNITKKILESPPYFVEKGHIVPYPNLDISTKKKILEMNQRIIEIAKVKDSIVHLEGKITNKGPLVLEFAVRMPGDRIMDLIEKSTGINMYHCIVDILTGVNVEVKNIKNKYSAVNWISSSQEGILKEIRGLDTIIETEKDLEMIDIIKNIGDKVKRVQSSFDRIGYYVISNENYDDLKHKMDNIEKNLKFSID